LCKKNLKFIVKFKIRIIQDIGVGWRKPKVKINKFEIERPQPKFE